MVISMDEIIDKPRKPKRQMHPNILANLRPAHNAAGRPKKEVCVTSWLKEYADTLATKHLDPQTLTYAQLAALQQWRAAAKGDLASYNFIIDRIEGKVVQAQAVDITTKGKAINDHRDIPTSVIDQAMEILYKSGGDSPSTGDDRAAQT